VLGLLWGYPFLVQGEGLSAAAAGALLTLLTFATMFAGPVIAQLVARRPFHRSTLVLVLLAAIVSTWTIALLWPGRVPLPMLVVLVLVTGVGGPASMVSFDFVRTFNPPERLGSATGIVNVGGWLATLLAMAMVGLVLDWRTPGSSTDYSTRAFRLAMCTQYLLWGYGGWQIWRYRRRARQLLATRDPKAYEALRRHGEVPPPIGVSDPASSQTSTTAGGSH
jgi:MFS family permease